MQNTAFRKTPPVVPGPSELSGSLAGALLRAPVALFDTLAAWQRQAEERAHLGRLSDHQLRDMGLTRAEAEEMRHKVIWTRRA